ncbi:MAG: hypothetical protein IPQ09_15225 [Myxococcales bacterium]|nr:hypothetical protein [Myxococcales bacterium]
MKVLQRLAHVSTGDPGHLVDLGDRYFQDGNQALAIQTWKRILAVIRRGRRPCRPSATCTSSTT